MKVVLPLNLKYKHDIIEAIINALLNESKLTYIGLYDRVTKILARTISHRDFDKNINKMVQDSILHKDDSGKKGAKVFYSLTESAIKGNQLEVLGVNEKCTKQRILYHLIFLRETHGLDYSIYEQDLDFFLSYVPASRNDLIIDSEDEVEEIVFTDYKPIMGVSIDRVSLKENTCNKAQTYYNIKLPGVSIRDVINPNLGRRISCPLPFDHIPFTEEEVREGIDKLQDAKLIKPIMYINDEERYSLVNNEFRELLDRLYSIHTIKMILLKKKWMYQRCTIEESKQLEFIYGKKEANQIINDCYIRRNEINTYKDSFPFIQQQLKSDYNEWMTKIANDIEKISEKYSNTLSNYGFNQDIAESLLFESPSSPFLF